MTPKLQVFTPRRGGGRGGSGKPPERTVCGAGGWYGPHGRLRDYLIALAGGEKKYERMRGHADGSLTYVAAGNEDGCDRRTAVVRFKCSIASVRAGWNLDLSRTLLRAFEGRTAVGIRPFTFRVVGVPSPASVLPGCDRRFSGLPTAAALAEFIEEVYEQLYGCRDALLALRRGEGARVTAAVVVPSGPGVAVAGDGYALAA